MLLTLMARDPANLHCDIVHKSASMGGRPAAACYVRQLMGSRLGGCVAAGWWVE